MVFVSESFDLPMARKLADLILSAQGTGALQSASLEQPISRDKAAMGADSRESLTDPLVRLLSSCGVSRAAVDAAMQAGRSIRIATLGNH
jgi:hypothetical protein